MNEHQTLDSYLSNLEDAWQLAYQSTLRQIEANERPTSLVDCVHNALLRSSLNTFAENLTPKIVARLFETDLWTLEDILTLVSIIPDHYRKAQNYVALLETEKLDHTAMINVREKALETAKAIDFPAYQSRMLEELSKFSDSDKKVEDLEKAVDAHIASAEGMFGGNAFSLCLLINELPDQMLKSTEQKLLALKNPEARAWTLAFLARRTNDNQQDNLLAIGLEAASQIKSDVNIANALAQLGGQLRGNLVPKALDLGLSLTEGNWRPRAIAGLMDKLDLEQVKRVLESILTIDDDWWRADGLISIINNSTGETQLRALRNLLAIRHGETRAKIFGWLNSYDTSQETINNAIHASEEIDDEEHRTQLLEELNRVSAKNEVLGQISNIENLEERANVLLAKLEENPDVTEYALNFWLTIQKVEDKPTKERLQRKYDEFSYRHNQLASRPIDYSQRLDEILQIDWEEERANELASFVGSMPDELIQLAVERSKKFLNWLNRDKVLSKLAPRLNEETLQSAIQGIADFEDTILLIHGMKNLAKHFEYSQRQIIYSYLLDKLLAEDNPKWVADELLKLRSELDGELREKATDHLPEEMRNTTYEELSAQRYAATLKQFEENPDLKKEFNEMIEAARNQYASQEITLPQMVQPLESLRIPDEKEKLYAARIDFLADLDEARHKKRESAFGLCASIPTLFEDNEQTKKTIFVIAEDILDIHQNWHWP